VAGAEGSTGWSSLKCMSESRARTRRPRSVRSAHGFGFSRLQRLLYDPKSGRAPLP